MMPNLIHNIRQPDTFQRVAKLLPRWSDVPLYQGRSPRLQSIPEAECPRCEFSNLPFVTKHEMRENHHKLRVQRGPSWLPTCPHRGPAHHRHWNRRFPEFHPGIRLDLLNLQQEDYLYPIYQ